MLPLPVQTVECTTSRFLQAVLFTSPLLLLPTPLGLQDHRWWLFWNGAAFYLLILHRYDLKVFSVTFFEGTEKQEKETPMTFDALSDVGQFTFQRFTEHFAFSSYKTKVCQEHEKKNPLCKTHRVYCAWTRMCEGTPTHLLPVVSAQPSEVTFVQVITSSEEPLEGAVAQCITQHRSSSKSHRATNSTGHQETGSVLLETSFSPRHSKLKCLCGHSSAGLSHNTSVQLRKTWYNNKLCSLHFGH